MLYDFGTSHLLPAAARFGLLLLLLLLPFRLHSQDSLSRVLKSPLILSGMSIEERYDLDVT